MYIILHKPFYQILNEYYEHNIVRANASTYNKIQIFSL